MDQFGRRARHIDDMRQAAIVSPPRAEAALVRALALLLAIGSASVSAAAPPAIGAAAPPFRIEDLAGTVRSLAGLRGKVIVLNHWATWCAPCKAELAALDAAYRARRGGGLEVIAVTGERGTSAARLRRWTQGLAIAVATGFAAGGANYAPVGGVIPSTYVIDRAGTVRVRRAGALSAAEVDAILAPLLAEPSPSAAD